MNKMNKLIKDYLITKGFYDKPRLLDVLVRGIINDQISDFNLLLLMEKEELNYIKMILRDHKINMILNEV